MMRPYRFPPRPRLLGVVAAAVLVLAGCGIRVGTPPAPIPSPDDHEVWRQQVAIAAASVDAAARGAAGASPVLSDLADVSGEYLEQLGGVWLPPPRDEDPSPTVPTFETGSSTEEVFATVVRASQEILPLAADEHTEAVVSMWVSWHTAAVLLSEEVAQSCPEPCGAMTSASLAELFTGLDEVARLVAQEAPELIGIYDAWGYTTEIRAARGPVESRDEIAAEARGLRGLAALLAEGADGSLDDPRLPAYDVDVADLDGSAHGYAQSAAATWLTLYRSVPEDAHVEVLQALWHAYTHSAPTLRVELWPLVR